ncbi:uncharacterized protein [Nicotiana tomentosiformis]|uniref:uncharacterized protein n=1 Tax=Nicotiana tomentosiformis TaxID=4098 RepID=UPI00388CCFA7
MDDLRELILDEAHSLRYSIHPEAMKMYRDLKQHYWWRRMKKDIVVQKLAQINIIAIGHLHGVLVSIISDRGTQFTSYFWRAIQHGGEWYQFLLLTDFSYNNSYQFSILMAQYEFLYGRRSRSPVSWYEHEEARLLGKNLVRDALEKVKLIQERLRTTRSRQNSYANRKVRDVAFIGGEKVLLRVSHMKGVMRFGKKVQLDEKLSSEEEPVAILDK